MSSKQVLPTCHFLLEIGCEELPPRLLSNLSSQLSDRFTQTLKDYRLNFSTLSAFATSRRLAILVRGLKTKQAEQLLEKKGPSTQVPKQVLERFMQSVGVSNVKQLIIKKVAKKQYFYYQTKQPGKKTAALLTEIIPMVIRKISNHRMMRWGCLAMPFIRPVRSLVALLDDKVIAFELFGLKSGRRSYGLRFAAKNYIDIKHAKCYEDCLLQLHIYADMNKRKARILKQIEEIAKREAVNVNINAQLLDEVCALVEAPSAFLGHFDKKFLALPEEVLILTMEVHQKYFALFAKDGGRLLPKFIAVSNLSDAKQSLDLVVSGNERVIYSRLSDAQFFYQSDISKPLIERLGALKKLAFMQSLGSMYDKVLRSQSLLEYIAKALQLSTDQQVLIRRAVQLSKCDLLTYMVVEFPKLQGIMGAYYARNDGEKDAVAIAIEQQYYPRFSGDRLPDKAAGYLLSLLDKLDTITGVYGLGKVASGSKDPYALRRLALGVVRIIIEKRLSLNILALIQYSCTLHRIKMTKPFASTILDFMLERLKIYYQDNNVATNIYQAVCLNAHYDLLDFNERILALQAFSMQKQAPHLALLNKRIANILKSVDANDISSKIDSNYFSDQSEYDLYKAVVNIEQQNLVYLEKMLLFCQLEPLIDRFFTAVMVNDNNVLIRSNRLALLAKIRQLLLSVADLSYLV